MHKYIDPILDVKGDKNYGYRVVSTLLDKRNDKYTFFCQRLIKEQYYEIHESLILCVCVAAPEKKWTCFLEMSHLIASAYSRVYIDLTKYSSCHTPKFVLLFSFYLTIT